LGYQGVNGPNLDPGAATAIAKLGSIDVIGAIGNKQRQRLKPFHNLLAGAWACEPLEQFLEYEPRGYDSFASPERGA
jgi:hypothetical protein